MDPVSAFTVFKAASAGATALAKRSEAMGESAQQELNAKLAETQGLQRDTLAREELQRSESATRASRGANNLSALSPNAALLFKERRSASDRDRTVRRSDDRIRAHNFRNAAKAARRRGRMSLITGVFKTAAPIAEHYA